MPATLTPPGSPRNTVEPRCVPRHFDDADVSRGDIVAEDMGTFRIDIEIENPLQAGTRVSLRSMLVDTGAELSWFPATVLEGLGIERRKLWRFRQADGTVLERWS